MLMSALGLEDSRMRRSKWKKEHPDFAKIARVLAKKYNLTPNQAFQAAGATVCDTCQAYGRVVPLVVDHDHVTGLYRGLLCSNCNTALGFAQDSPIILRKLAHYLASRRGEVRTLVDAFLSRVGSPSPDRTCSHPSHLPARECARR